MSDENDIEPQVELAVHPTAQRLLDSPLYPPEGPPPAVFTREARTTLGLMTEEEFGRAVGVSGKTVASWRQQGEGPAYFRFRRGVYYRTADITQWLIENTWDPHTNELMLPRQPVNSTTKSTRQPMELSDAGEDHEP